ncbi:MAG: choice-of-anchor D domain-containing protein [Myxococcaceae bacterium]|nr:choice-of-anchor D domain-containing protein [Myxococcaceae bacterium]
MISNRSVLLSCAAVCLTVVTGCEKTRVVDVTYCRMDVDCPGGYLCESFECVPKNAKTCENVNDGNPILQPTPHTVDFGSTTSTAAQSKKLLLTNIGNCTLTLFESNLARGDAGVGCEFCGTSFPKEIFPGRSEELSITWAPAAPVPMANELRIISDDKEYPTFRLPIRGHYIGSPALTVAPNPVNFGYVAVGRQVRRNVSVSNRGTGIAPVTITAIAVEPAMNSDFDVVLPMGTLPKTLRPITEDKDALLSFEARFTPRSSGAPDGGDTSSTLVFTTSEGELRVPMAGNSATPPVISVAPMMVDLGDVRLGTTLSRPLTITNSGGAPLTVRASWGGTRPSTDLSTAPQLIPAIPGGTFSELQVVVTATAAGPITGLLQLDSNDPMRPVITVPVTANGVSGPGPEVVKLEMTYDNGSDTVFDNDVRDVDMTLEHPFGYVCNERTPAPMNWGMYGNPTWLAFAPKEEPERIVLADARTDGTYRVMVTYQQDCKSLPSALLAGILGISIDVLVDVLTGGAVPIPGQDIGRLIEQVCLSKSSSAVNVKVFVNGMLIAEKNTSLGRKGDSAYILNLVRSNGTFSVP